MKPNQWHHLPESAPIRLVLRSDRSLVTASFLYRVPRTHVEQTEIAWRVYREQLLNRPAQERHKGPENARWDWIRKRQEVDEDHGDVCAIEAEGRLQGLVLYAFAARPSRTSAILGEPTMYVEYLEAAPYNLISFVGEEARFGGVGTQLLLGAIDVSRRFGWRGRLSLHALAGAREFYRRMGFCDFGFDRNEGLHYFELTGAAVTSFPSRGRL